MEIGAEMTPEQYTAKMRILVAAGADEQIIALAREHGNEIHPQLTDDELDGLYGVIESAVMAVDLEAMTRRSPAASAAST